MAEGLSEQKLMAEIEGLVVQYQSRLGAVLQQPGPTGYSSRVLCTAIAVIVEFQSRIFAMMPLAGTSDTAAQRLFQINFDLQRKLKEASYMAAFKTAYEEFEAYINNLPASVPPGAPLRLLTASIDRFVEFEQRFHSFEPRAAELASEGILPLMQQKWLAPSVQIAQRHIAAMRKRCDDEMVAAQAREQRGQQCINEFNRIWYEMNTAVNSVNARIQAMNGDMWADRSRYDTELYNHYQTFLRGVARLEPAAAELSAQGQPQLLQSMQAWKADIEKAAAIVKQMAGVQAANKVEMMKKASEMQEEWWRHYQETYKAQQEITKLINSYKP